MRNKADTVSLQRASAINVVVAKFGRDVTHKLLTGDGSAEDHLRAPFERMLLEIGSSLGLRITAVGEASLPDLSIRPDYAIDVAGSRVGYVELKRPGHGIPGIWKKPTAHDKQQWSRLQLLPNVLYTDGQAFARFHFGKLQGRIGFLQPGLSHAGHRLRATDSAFATTISTFLLWEPERPRTLEELVRLTANLCRLLREDIVARISKERAGECRQRTFSGLADDWRQVLFPNLDDEAFADQYAQTVTFALLLARVDGISFNARSLGEIARLLGKKHSLMGKALAVLTDQPEEEQSIALATMLRVLTPVDWGDFPSNAYSMLYESFLTRYDPALRKKSGVYYTPAPVVSFLTRFTEDVLRERLDRSRGFAENDVIVVDPAMGTGSFLAEVVDRVAETIAQDEGPGAVAPQLRDLSDRLVGFENQAAPYAVAELRIHSLLRQRHHAEIPLAERRFLTDTLDDPNVQLLPIGSLYDVIKRVRDGANAVKREDPVMVVIGNPPFVDKVRGSAPWIEEARSSRSASPSISAFRSPGNGRFEYVLANKYVYFWRWATWKTFDAHPGHPAGIVSFICPAGFLSGRGFAGMREYLRRTADEGWIVDLSPEGHQPSMATRVFRGNQQPICIAVFVRYGSADPHAPATIWRTDVEGTFAEKCYDLNSLELDQPRWQECSNDWTANLAPADSASWQDMPSIDDLFPWVAPGLKPNRTWVYAPEASTLRERWRRLISATREEKAILFKESDSRRVNQPISPVPGMPPHGGTIEEERGIEPPLQEVSLRSFDRQWTIADARVHHRPSPSLWLSHSPQQIYATEQHAHRVSSGPAVTFTDLIPDMDHHSGRGGRVIPRYRDPGASEPNTLPGLSDLLSTDLGITVAAGDVFSYLACVVSHRGFTETFQKELRTPGVRIPLTASPKLWKRAVELGNEVIKVHTFGMRPSGKSATTGRMRMATNRPMVTATISDKAGDMPESISYDPSSMSLMLGTGAISPVSQAAWSYDVAGMPVIRHWFGYRKRSPSGKKGSELDEIVPDSWTAAMTTELLDLINVVELCIELEPTQREILSEILSGDLITLARIDSQGLRSRKSAASRPPKAHGTPRIW